jgi:hypothetical protein
MWSGVAYLSKSGSIQEILENQRTHSAGDQDFEKQVRTDLLPDRASVYVIRDASTHEIYRVGESEQGVWRNVQGFRHDYPRRVEWASRRVEIVHFDDEEFSASAIREAVEAALLEGKSYPGNASRNENRRRLTEIRAEAGHRLEVVERLVRQIARYIEKH